MRSLSRVVKGRKAIDVTEMYQFFSDFALEEEKEEEAPETDKSLHKTGAGKIRMSKSASVSAELNLIGMTVDEALAHLDYLEVRGRVFRRKERGNYRYFVRE